MRPELERPVNTRETRIQLKFSRVFIPGLRFGLNSSYMGILTILCGLLMLGLGLGSVVTKRALLPELKPGEVMLATVPFGLVITVIGVIIQTAK